MVGRKNSYLVILLSHIRQCPDTLSSLKLRAARSFTSKWGDSNLWQVSLCPFQASFHQETGTRFESLQTHFFFLSSISIKRNSFIHLSSKGTSWRSKIERGATCIGWTKKKGFLSARLPHLLDCLPCMLQKLSQKKKCFSIMPLENVPITNLCTSVPNYPESKVSQEIVLVSEALSAEYNLVRNSCACTKQYLNFCANQCWTWRKCNCFRHEKISCSSFI